MWYEDNVFHRQSVYQPKYINYQVRTKKTTRVYKTMNNKSLFKSINQIAGAIVCDIIIKLNKILIVLDNVCSNFRHSIKQWMNKIYLIKDM